MKKYILGAVLSLGILISPALTQAAGLTTDQATVLINVVKSSPSTPAGAFVNLITAFSGVTVNQATALITVVQSSPATPASVFIPLLTSFTSGTTGDTTVTTQTQISVPTISYINPTSATIGDTVYVYGLFGSNPYIQFDGKKVESTKVANDKITETVLSFIVPSYTNTGTHYVQVVGTVGTPSVTMAGPSVTMDVTASAIATAPTVTPNATTASTDTPTISDLVLYSGSNLTPTLNLALGTSATASWYESGTKDAVFVYLDSLIGSQWTQLTLARVSAVGRGQNSVGFNLPTNLTTASRYQIYVETIGAGDQSIVTIVTPTTTTGLTSTQIASTLSLLTSFSASSAAISNVNTVISGGTVSTTNLAPSGLTSSQVQSILSLLQSFGANSTTLANVNAIISVTGTLAPTVTLTASNSNSTITVNDAAPSGNISVVPGTPISFTWSGGTSCWGFSGGWNDGWYGSKASSGSITVSAPSAQTTYRLSCTVSGASVDRTIIVSQ